jgi:hypothetical protein
MLERRKEQRWPAYLGGRIICDRRESTADCLIRSTSPSGARLVFSQADLLPDEFSLQVPVKKTEMRVTTRWRRGYVVGVETVPWRNTEAPVDLSMARRLRQLDEQDQRLKRRIAELSEPQR